MQPVTTTREPSRRASLRAITVSTDSCRASSMKAHVLTTMRSASSADAARSMPPASNVPPILPESTWFLGQPNVSTQKRSPMGPSYRTLPGPPQCRDAPSGPGQDPAQDTRSGHPLRTPAGTLAQDTRSGRRDHLEAVAEAVVGVEAAHRRELVVPPDRIPRRVEGLGQCVEVVDHKRGVGFGGRPEVVF